MTRGRLRVDLDRLFANIAAVRERVAPAQFMLVVKNDAYGHGLERIVSGAVTRGVDWFGAFDIDTGVRARASAGEAPRVFSWVTADRDKIADAIEARLELGVGDRDYLEDIAHVAALSSVGRPVPVHLKIDTGLHRNGVRPEDWAAVVARAAELESAGRVKVVGVWSHIAETSDESDDESRAQFLAAVAAAQAAGLKPELSHLAASAAAYARPEFRHDLARIGAFSYGVRSTDGPELPGIEPAATLLAPVVAVHGSDGPGSDGHGSGDGRSDAVRIAHGSLDGLPSTLAGRVRVGTPAGPRALLRVDPTSSTVAAWPGAAIGDEVAMFGPGAHGESSATTLAEAIGTVGEEILVRVSPLVPREYIGG